MLPSLTEKEWETFFELIDKIVDSTGDPRPWKEKAEEVTRRAGQEGSATNFAEFTGWFI